MAAAEVGGSTTTGASSGSGGASASSGSGERTDPLRDVINAAPVRSSTGGMLERARAAGEPLTDNQLQILEICKEDEEERNRLLFGGGLW